MTKQLRFVAFFLTIFFSKETIAQNFIFPLREESFKKTAGQMYNHIGSWTNKLPDTITATNYLWTMSQYASTFPKMLTNQTLVKMYVDHAISHKYSDAYVYRMAYTLIGYDHPNNTSSYTTIHDTLTIGYNPDTLTAYQDMQVKMYQGFYKAIVVVNNIFYYSQGNPPQIIDPQTLSSLDTNFIVEVALNTQVYTRGNYIPADMGLDVACNADSISKNYLMVNWNLSGQNINQSSTVTPANYELEWTYIDDYNASASDLHFDFRNNSSRVVLRDNQYKIPIIYQDGYLMFRVRMVRPDSLLLKTPIYGQWTLPDNGNIGTYTSGGSSSHYLYHITTPYMGDSTNWQYTISFAEEGKYKHVLSYFDGLLYNRQSITRFNSLPNKLIVTENIYDFEGHPAIKTLPAPVSSPSFRFQPNVTLHSSGNPYTAYLFDTVLKFTCPGEIKIAPLSSSSIASKYYSTSNPDQGGFQKFVPNAEGYPFVQTIYSAGYDKRIEKQGGAGDKLQIGTGNETTNDFVSADQMDLNRLLGLNAGIESYYHKTVTKDPNGQYSVNIKDYKDRQVMTSLTGEINSYTHALVKNDEVPPDSMYYSNLLAGGTQMITNSSRILDKSFYVEAPSNDTLKYIFRLTPYPICTQPTLGLSVQASYKYHMLDQCGVKIFADSGIVGVTGVITNTNAIRDTIVRDTFFEKGKYTVHKELFVNEADVDKAIDSFFRYTSPTCLLTENWFIRKEVESHPYPCPEPLDPCSKLKQQLMDELFPHAKYGLYNDINNLVSWDSVGHNSIFDKIYPPWKTDTWHYRYQDSCLVLGLDTVTIIKDSITYTRLDTIDVHTFIYLFSGNNGYKIAEKLLPLHPEYCKMQACFNDTFRVRFEAIPNAMIADTLHLLSLDSIVKQDTALVGKLDALFGAGIIHYGDSLKYLSSIGRYDTLCLKNAYCNCSDSTLSKQCLGFFSSQIHNLILPPSDSAKNFYFKQLKELYLFNHDKYKNYLYNVNEHCGPCDSVRMKLYPAPIIPVYYASNGTLNTTSNSSVFNQFGTGVQTAMNNLNNSGYQGTPGSAMSSTYQDSATILYNSADTMLSRIALDSIVSKMINCPQFYNKKTAFKNYLKGLIDSGYVHFGQFYPDQIDSAFASASITRGDLCNPYIVDYDYYGASSIGGISAGCKSDQFYSDVKAWFNDSTILNLLDIGGIDTVVLTSTSNLFGNAIFSYFSLSPGTDTFLIGSYYDNSKKLYHLTVTKSGTVLDLYIKYSASTNAGNIFSKAGGASALFSKISCIKEQPLFSAKGYIGSFVFAGKIARTISSTVYTYQSIGWSNAALKTTSDETNLLSGCVPCTEVKKNFQDFINVIQDYNVKGVDHPLFGKMLKNYMNFHLKRLFIDVEYLKSIQSCALADSMQIPKYLSYGFAKVSNYSTFKTLLNNNGIVLKNILRYRDSLATYDSLIIDYTQVPYYKLAILDSLILTQYGSSVNTGFKPYDNDFVGMLLFPGTLTSIPSSINSVFSYSSPQHIQVYRGGTFKPYTRFNVLLPTSLTSYTINRKIDTISQYVMSQSAIIYWLTGKEATVNKDYYKTEKQGLLQYTYSLQQYPMSKVLDSLMPNHITANAPAFSGESVSYQLPATPGSINNLYYSGSTNLYYGDTILKYLIHTMNSYLGGHKLFPNQTYDSVVVISSSNESFKVFHCKDGSYWYRYFDGNNDKIYNVYFTIPKYIYSSYLPLLEYDSLILNMGDTTSRNFDLTVKVGSVLQPYAISGYADFNINWSSKLKDIFLSDDPVPPLMGIPAVSNNCEQSVLQGAIYTGKVKYEQYIDSFKQTIKPKFLAYLQDSIYEELDLGYDDRRFGITLYLYDRAGNLTTTIPPGGVHKLNITTAKNVDTARKNNTASINNYLPAHKKKSSYYYNSKNQLYMQVTPDGGEVRYYYDVAGRLIATHNDLQGNNKASYIRYDAQNRVIETGVSTNIVLPIVSNNVNSYKFDSTIVSTARIDVVATIYDHESINLGLISGMSRQDNLRKRVSCVKFFDNLGANINSDTSKAYAHATHYSYDASGNVKTLTQEFPELWNKQQQFKRIDYEYDLWSGKVNQLSYNRSFADQYYQRYGYDADNRITKVESSRDGVIWKQEASYEYYQHGPLARARLGDLRVQSLDYAYTIQGWLKAINSDTLNSSFDMGNDGLTPHSTTDGYATTIDYFKGDYKSIGNTQTSHFDTITKKLYNGNIARQSTAILPFNELVTQYTYDQLNRIKNADYNQIAISYGDSTYSFLAPIYGYGSSYKYDQDGNITKLRRYNSAGSAYMDDMTYYYSDTLVNNKLVNITDAAAGNGSVDNDIPYMTNTSAIQYRYDAIGRLTKDGVNHIDTIYWNSYDKVKETRNNTSKTIIDFKYDGMGNRVFKNVNRNLDSAITNEGEYYVRDAQGNIIAIFRRESNYKVSPIKLIEPIKDYAIGHLGSSTHYVNDVLIPEYAVKDHFMNFFIDKADSSMTVQPMSNYLKASPALLSNFANSSVSFIDSLQNYELNTNKNALGIALLKKHNQDNSVWNTLSACLRLTDSTKYNLLAAMPKALADSLDLFMAFPRDTDSVAKMIVKADLLSNDIQLLYYMNKCSAAIPDTVSKYIYKLAHSKDWVNNANMTRIGTADLLQDALANYGVADSFMGAFFDAYSGAYTLLKSQANLTERKKILYSGNPVAWIDTMVAKKGLSITDTALAAIPWIDPINLTYKVASVNNVNAMDVMPTTQNVLTGTRHYLAEHHLYGSSRLGIVQYLPMQYYQSWDYQNPQSNGKPTVDSLTLFTKQPWYSGELQTLIKKDSVAEFGNQFASTLYAQHLLGQKQFELTNHLGNVMATVSDKVYEADSNNDGVIKHTYPAFKSVYDYHPFGMLMPQRYKEWNSSNCITSTKDVWVTVIDTYYIDMPHVDWATLGGTRFDPSDDYGHPIFDETNTLTGIYIQYTDDGLYGDFSSLEVGGNYDFVFDVPNVLGTNLQMQVVELLEDRTERILATKDIAGPDENLSINFTPSTRDIRVKVVRLDAEGSEVPYISIKNLKWYYYHQQLETQLVSICSDVNDLYRFGFNGMHKDNEMKGIGNSLDFGARMEDTRIAKLGMLIDPLFKKFPGQSPYIFAGDNPIMFIDEEGKLKTTNYKIYDQATGQTLTKTIYSHDVLDRTINVVKPAYHDYETNHEWFDYTVNINITIDKNGKQTFSTNTITGKKVATTWYANPLIAWGVSNLYDNDDLFKSKDKGMFGGWHLTSGEGGGSDSKFNPSAGKGTVDVDAGTILKTLGKLNKLSTQGAGDALEAIEYLNDAVDMVNENMKDKDNPMPVIDGNKSFSQCEICGAYSQDGKAIDDTSKKGINKNNTTKQSLNDFHESIH